MILYKLSEGHAVFKMRNKLDEWEINVVRLHG